MFYYTYRWQDVTLHKFIMPHSFIIFKLKCVSEVSADLSLSDQFHLKLLLLDYLNLFHVFLILGLLHVDICHIVLLTLLQSFHKFSKGQHRLQLPPTECAWYLLIHIRQCFLVLCISIVIDLIIVWSPVFFFIYYCLLFSSLSIFYLLSE